MAAILNAAAVQGLSQAEARRRLKQDGPNELPQREGRGLIRTAFEVLREPMILLLLAAGSVYIVLGDREEAVLLLASIGLIVGIELYQERRTERTLEALRDLSSPRALVIRDGEQQRIAGREVVRDDVVLLAEGDRVPADAVLVSASNLAADESLLTGESVPVRKVAREPWRPRNSAQVETICRTCSLARWSPRARAWAASSRQARTRRWGASARAPNPGPGADTAPARDRPTGPPPGGGGSCAVRPGGWAVHAAARQPAGRHPCRAHARHVAGTRGVPGRAHRLPRAGAWRIAQQHVLTRRAPAVEALGTATVLCVDKTGTLTQNRMAVRRLSATSRSVDVVDDTQRLPEWAHSLVQDGVLASSENAFDPMEQAIHATGSRLLPRTHTQTPGTLVRAYPLSDALLAVVHVWKAPSD